MQNQDTVFQQVCSVRVHLTPQFLQTLTVVGSSYSRTTRYPVCHDHTVTIVRESHHLFHVRLGPLEFFRSRGTFASPLTGLRFQFRLETPDPGFVNSNHLLQKFVWVFPRNVSILMYARWSSLVTVPETRTAAISTLCHFHVHTPPETNYTALASRSSPVQLLKWQDRWHQYLCSVANVCISFEITHVCKNRCIFVCIYVLFFMLFIYVWEYVCVYVCLHIHSPATSSVPSVLWPRRKMKQNIHFSSHIIN